MMFKKKLSKIHDLKEYMMETDVFLEKIRKSQILEHKKRRSGLRNYRRADGFIDNRYIVFAMAGLTL